MSDPLVCALPGCGQPALTPAGPGAGHWYHSPRSLAEAGRRQAREDAPPAGTVPWATPADQLDLVILNLCLERNGPSVDVVASLTPSTRVLVHLATAQPSDVAACMCAGAA